MKSAMGTSDVSRLPQKRPVTVHVTFLKVGEINTLKETFDADVLVRSRWREPELDKMQDDEEIDFKDLWNPKLYIDNAVGEPRTTCSQAMERNAYGEAFVVERKRFKGGFLEQMELFEFPFDVQDLTVTVMSDVPAGEVDIVEDNKDIHRLFKQSFIDEQEFYLYKYIESSVHEKQKDRADPYIRRCALEVTCKCARRPWCFVFNHFMVTFLLACMAFVTFAVEPKLVQNRLQLSFTLILTNVAFKFVVAQNLPKISYLTYLDRYVLATMITVALVCFWHALQTRLPDYQDRDLIAFVLLGGLYVIYNIQFLMRLVLVPFGRRRQLKHLEAKYTAKVKEIATKRHSSRGSSMIDATYSHTV